jgi:hypothetical protein
MLHRSILLTAIVLVLGVPAVAAATGEGRSLLGGTRNPSHGAFSRETEVIANNPTYGTRQSNKRQGDGGGAIYGCRSDAGHEPCVRGVNLRNGHGFEFETKKGKEGGSITIGDPTGVPFTTNATGKVANLNADKLDDKDSSDFAAAGDLLFAVVNADGSLVAGGRGATGATKAVGSEIAYTVIFNRDVSKCSYTASAAGASSDFGFGVQAANGNANAVTVSEPTSAGSGAGRGFHLQVVC